MSKERTSKIQREILLYFREIEYIYDDDEFVEMYSKLSNYCHSKASINRSLRNLEAKGLVSLDEFRKGRNRIWGISLTSKGLNLSRLLYEKNLYESYKKEG